MHNSKLRLLQTRQALCESVPYYHAYNSSAYTKGGFVIGVLLDEDLGDCGYLDEEIVMFRV